MMAADTILELRDVHKSFGEQKVLDGISLSMHRGSVACLIGPSGSGKSTLLRCVNGLVSVDKGAVRVDGSVLGQADLRSLRRRVGIVFQQYNLFPHMSALENVMVAPIKVLGRSRQEVEPLARALLRKVRLQGNESKRPSQLSGGQQQRVAIARSLAMGPAMMLFDEVTAALDPETSGEVLLTIREMASEGMTCLMVTHEMAFARRVADHIFFTDGGKLVESGHPEQVFGAPQDERTKRFLRKVLK